MKEKKKMEKHSDHIGMRRVILIARARALSFLHFLVVVVVVVPVYNLNVSCRRHIVVRERTEICLSSAVLL